MSTRSKTPGFVTIWVEEVGHPPDSIEDRAAFQAAEELAEAGATASRIREYIELYANSKKEH